jgi:tRNA pseudouridine65 synthase
MTNLPILFHDEHCIAVDKPSGLLVHPSNIDRHETRFAMRMIRDQIGRLVYPVHRIDKATSGVLLFALSSGSSAKLCADFRERRVSKQYIAVVRGYFEKESGVLDRPLATNPTWKAGKFAETRGEPQTAETHYQTLSTCEIPFAVGRYPTARYSLISLEPKTGRRHQIRRHLKHAAHPIVGDTTHGDHRHNHFLRERFGLTRMMLVARRLGFDHPVSGDRIEIAAELGDEFAMLLDQIGLRRT